MENWDREVMEVIVPNPNEARVKEEEEAYAKAKECLGGKSRAWKTRCNDREDAPTRVSRCSHCEIGDIGEKDGIERIAEFPPIREIPPRRTSGELDVVQCTGVTFPKPTSRMMLVVKRGGVNSN